MQLWNAVLDSTSTANIMNTTLINIHSFFHSFIINGCWLSLCPNMTEFITRMYLDNYLANTLSLFSAILFHSPQNAGRLYMTIHQGSCHPPFCITAQACSKLTNSINCTCTEKLFKLCVSSNLIITSLQFNARVCHTLILFCWYIQQTDTQSDITHWL